MGIINLSIFKSVLTFFDIFFKLETKSTTLQCCEIRGVPEKCILACGGSSELASRENNVLCNDYQDVIDRCKSNKGENN